MSKSDSTLAHKKACKQNLYFLKLNAGPWSVDDLANVVALIWNNRLIGLSNVKCKKQTPMAKSF